MIAASSSSSRRSSPSSSTRLSACGSRISLPLLRVGDEAGDARGQRRDFDREALEPGGDLREFGDRQPVALGQRDGPEHRVLELAQVAGPVVALQQRAGLRREPREALALVGGEAGREGKRARSGISSRRTRRGGRPIGRT